MSKQEDIELIALYEGWHAAFQREPDMSLEDRRALFEHWGDVTAEPGQVDYLIADIGKLKGLWAVPKDCASDRVLLCSHGGGYALCSPYSHRKLFAHFAKAIGCRALLVDYRLAPENLHPAQVDDMVDAYQWLLDSEGISRCHIALLGDSAGGALAITTMLRAQERGLPLPAASIPLAPYLDMEATGSTFEVNEPFDKLGTKESALAFADMILGEGGDRRDPLVNPLHADLAGLPPLYIQVGGYDVILDDSQRLYARAGSAGVEAELDVVPRMQHVFQFLAGASQTADDAIARAAAWARPLLGLV